MSRHSRSILAIATTTILVAGLSGCFLPSPSRELPSTAADSARGISPWTVELSWATMQTADRYQVYKISQAQTSLVTTQFTTADVGSLQADTQFTLAVRGVRGIGSNLPTIDTWTFSMWKDFTQASVVVGGADANSVTINWNYLPWTSLPPTDDAKNNTEVSCNFLPYDPAVTDPTTLNPFTGAGAVSVSGPLVNQTLVVPRDELDPVKAYVVGCEADFIDGSSSRSTARPLVLPRHVMNQCPTNAFVDKQYDCQLMIKLEIDTAVPVPVTGWNIITSGPLTRGLTLCDPAVFSVQTLTNSAGSTFHLQGSPTVPDIGACTVLMTYNYTASDGVSSLTSPPLKLGLNIAQAPAFTVFPAFAVRALSGAIAAYNPETAPSPSPSPSVSPSPNPSPSPTLPACAPTNPYSCVNGSIVSDFGNGNTFFVGGSTPFPAGGALTTSMYGFPSGFTLDAIRPSNIAQGGSEGFLQGNLVVPVTTISNTGFLTAAGLSSAVSLQNFLENRYLVPGASGSHPPLSDYLTSITPTPFTGKVLQQNTVTIQAPARDRILQYFGTSVNTTQGVAQIVAGETRYAAIVASSIPFPITQPNSDDNNAPMYKMMNLKFTGTVGSSAGYYSNYVTADPSSDQLKRYAGSIDPAAPLPRDVKVYCAGDVVVRYPIIFRNVQIVIPQGQDCRIYSSESIFIQGTVTVNLGLQVLQLSSARAVIFGFDSTSLGTGGGALPRPNAGLIGLTYGGPGNNRWLTRLGDAPSSSSSRVLDAIAVDASIVGFYDGAKTIVPKDDSSPISYQHLAVNAPLVLSNYTGLFNGSIAAEVVWFRKLNFNADLLTLSSINPWPLLSGADQPVIISTP